MSGSARRGETNRGTGRPPTVRPLLWAGLCAVAPLLAGCGKAYVFFHPQGPVAKTELHLFVLASLIMGAVTLIVFALVAVAVVRFRERTNRSARTAPYTPEYGDNRPLELLWFLIPAAVLAVIAIPTVTQTFRLAHVPTGGDPLVVDVTSLSWKWLFQEPGQHIATVNYVVIPAGKPVLFRLTADSAMNAFWVPELGGMEYNMPGEVLPLWLEADEPGTYWGHSGQFSGVDFEKMFFTVRALSAQGFSAWVQQVHRTAKPMTMSAYNRLLVFGTTGEQTYSSYPPGTFPSQASGFGLVGGHYVPVTGGDGGMATSLTATAAANADPAGA